MISDLTGYEFVPPFKAVIKKYRRRTIRKRKEAGVYLISENDVITYVGMSQSCLTEALYRHFYPYNWRDKQRKYRTFYDVRNGNTYKVYVIYCSKENAPKLERGLVIGLQPRDNKDKFETYISSLVTPENTPPHAITTEIEEAPF